MRNSFAEKQTGKSRSPFARAIDKTPSAPFDWWLFTIMLVILAVGLVMVLSASGIVAERVNGDKYYFFKRQLLFALAGGAALWAAALLPRQWLYRLQYPALFLSLLLLLITLSPFAPAINGAKRWIPLGPVSIQPMEFVKIALALYLAYFMSSKQDLIKTFSRGVIPPFAVTGLFCFLLLLQPDFGSAVVLAGILFFMCVAGGTRFIYLFFSLALACAGAMALAIASPYRLRRLLAFLDPFQDAHNTGYQLVQSLLAIGSGSFFGVGVGASRQKMFYLPEAHNDFIMAVLAEEMGFVGMTVVMGLFALLFWRCYRIIMGQRNLRDRFTAFGITAILAMGAVMNLAVVMGVAPPKGVPMPLMSYGGSNLLATMICVGLLLNFFKNGGFMDKILLTTGGTGGHIFPALAVAEELRRRNPDIQLLFAGSLYGPEQRLAARAGIPFVGLPVRGFLGRGLRAVGAGARMSLAVCKALGIVRRFRPDVVAGFGGYAAFAPMLAARLLGVPGILHEQNAVAGTSNRLLARLARKVCLSLPDTRGFAPAKCVLTGNPVRRAVSDAGRLPRRRETRRLLVLGGSQGARALNVFLPEILPALREAGVEIRHQSGFRDEESTRAAYERAGYSPECVTAFIDDMAGAYAWADLALCRAGASTVAELCAAGLPAVLVPFPHAVHDHQTRNAQVLEKAGAALLVPEKRLRERDLGRMLPDLLNDSDVRARMSAAALAAARPDAAARVAGVLAEVADGRGRRAFPR